MEESSWRKIVSFLTNPMVIGWLFSIDVIIIRFFIFPEYSPLIEKDFPLIQNFIEWFGVAYGLFIALVLVNVWSQFDATEREFDREADAIYMLYESTNQIKETKKNKALKRNIIEDIKNYVQHVNDCYQKEHENLDVRENGDEILERIRGYIGEIVHTREKEAITAQLVKEFNEAVDIRGDRISHSNQHIPDAVWGISLTSSILWLLPFLGLNFDNDWVAIVLVGGVTVIVIAILAIIKDLDDPFEGTWKIKTDEWQLLGEKIGLKPTLILVFNLSSRPLFKMLLLLNNVYSKRFCVLFSLIGRDREQNLLKERLNGRAYIRFYYKDEFQRYYERQFNLPVVLHKSGRVVQPLVDATELIMIAGAPELTQAIEQRF